MWTIQAPDSLLTAVILVVQLGAERGLIFIFGRRSIRTVSPSTVGPVVDQVSKF
jgi:hypothetical protein